MQLLKANTQVKVVIGPFVDVGDGFTPETGVALGTADEAEIMKHDAAAVTDISGNTWAAIGSADGYYNLTLTTTDTNTEGMLTVIVQDDSVCLPVRATFMVMAEAAYDSMFVAKDTGYMDVNVKAVSEDTTAADNLESACDNYSVTRGLSGTALPAAAADAAGGLPISDAGGLDLDAMNTNVSSILTDTGTTLDGKINTIDTNVDAILVDTGTTLDNHLTDIKGTGFAKDTHSLTNIEGYADLIDDGTSGLAKIATDVAAILVDTGTTLDGKINTIDTNVDAILVDTGTTLDGKINTIDTNVDSILVDTGTTLETHLTDIKGTGFAKDTNSLVNLSHQGGAKGTDDIHDTIDGLNNISAADVNTQVLDVLNTDTFAEPGQEAPPATTTLVKKISYLYKFLRNKIDNDGSTIQVYADDTTTVDQKSTVSEAAGTVTRGEFGSGP